MNINDEQFNNFNSASAVALRFAGILADMVKHKASRSDIALWDSVPQISADAKWHDIVKDFSIRGHHEGNLRGFNADGKAEYEDLGGQVGVVIDVREIRKRDGRTAVEVEIVFFNHTTIGKYRSDSAKRRKLQFIKG
jgi:hypothetical protein